MEIQTLETGLQMFNQGLLAQNATSRQLMHSSKTTKEWWLEKF